MKRLLVCALVAVTCLVAHALAGHWLASRDVIADAIAGNILAAAIAALWLALRLILVFVLPGWLLYRVLYQALGAYPRRGPSGME